MTYLPNDDNRKFTELYNVQRLKSSFVAKDSQVCISTIQRMYALLKDEPLDETAEETNPAELMVRPDASGKREAPHLLGRPAVTNTHQLAPHGSKAIKRRSKDRNPTVRTFDLPRAKRDSATSSDDPGATDTKERDKSSDF
jgi:hypothetical protein